MTVRFADAGRRECQTPISGEPGPDMQVCGERTVPGRTCCPACLPRLYWRYKGQPADEAAARRPLCQERIGRD